MSSTRPLVFIGSSSEALPVVEAVQLECDGALEVVAWPAIFNASNYTLETLESEIKKFDAAVFVLTGDDFIKSRGKKQVSARDNVLVEIGLSIGTLGRKKTFLVMDRSVDLKIPSDLLGINLLTFQPPTKGNWRSSLSPVCVSIRNSLIQRAA